MVSRRRELHNCETVPRSIVVEVDKNTTRADVRKMSCRRAP